MFAIFHYDNQQVPTLSQLKQQISNLFAVEKKNIAQQNIFQLIQQRTNFCDALIQHLWQWFELHQEVDIALFAVGGYGRKEMFPHSDLDCLILFKQPVNEIINNKIQQFIQYLWDCGFKVGQSVRTLEECQQLAKEDITIATNLLEHRFICGDIKLKQNLINILSKPDFWSVQDFYQAKIEEQQARYQRFHNTNYNVEPDLKYSPGGLRDLHLLYWIALRAGAGKNLEQLYHSKWICTQEYECLKESQTILFTLRFALHLNLKRDDNRLLFERQRQVSESLDYEQEGNDGVEMMMKSFFYASQNIQVLTQILLKHYANNLLCNVVTEELISLDTYFVYNDQFISSKDINVFNEDPLQILQLFYYLTCYPHHQIHPDTLRQLYLAIQSLRKQNVYLMDDDKARELFLRILAQPQGILLALKPMHQYGVLSIYLPQWRTIEGLMQFDLFHIYTVDEHTLRVLQNLEDFLLQKNQEKFPLCTQVFSQIPEPSLLYISALFHDIGKGKGGDHSQIGAKLIHSFAILHGFDKREVETMAWLVENHLLFSMTAQRRDIQDPEVIQEFTYKVQNLVRLDYLLCLTVADIYATNEKLWNSWKFSLFNSLYQNSKVQLAQGIQYLRNNQLKIEENQIESIKLLQHKYQLSNIEIKALWQYLPEEYFLRNDPRKIVNWTMWLQENQQDLMENKPMVKVSNRFCTGGTALLIYTKDQPQLFYNIVSTLEAKKFSVHDAQIQTMSTGYAFDSFIITELDGSTVRFERRRILEQSVKQVLLGHKKAHHRLHQSYKLKPFNIQTQVRFVNTDKVNQTEMEVFALDKAGLLAEIGEIFYQFHINLHQAKISTIGEKAEDFFVLTNKKHKALTVEEREQLKTKLLTSL